MTIRVIKYSQFKKWRSLETYKPKNKINLRKENVFPAITKTGNRFYLLGGLAGIFGSIILIFMKGFYIIKENLTRVIPGRIIEIKIKNK